MPRTTMMPASALTESGGGLTTGTLEGLGEGPLFSNSGVSEEDATDSTSTFEGEPA